MRPLILAALIALPVMAQTKKADAPKEPAKTAASPTPTTTSQATKYDLLLAKFNELSVDLETTKMERDHWKQVALGSKVAGEQARAEQQLNSAIQRAQQECGGPGKLRDLSGNCIVGPANEKPVASPPNK